MERSREALRELDYQTFALSETVGDLSIAMRDAEYAFWRLAETLKEADYQAFKESQRKREAE